MKKIVAYIAVAVLCLTATASAVEINSKQFISYSTSAVRSKVPATLSTVAREFSVNVPAMASAFKSSYQTITLTEFPVSKTETATLQLVPAHSVIDANTEWYVGSKQVELPDVVSYKGTIVGEPNSKVMLNYANGDLMGYVIRGTGEQFAVSPYGSSVTADRVHTIAPENVIAVQNGNTSFNCGTDEFTNPMQALPAELHDGKSGSKTLSTKTLELKMIVESTSGFYVGPGRSDPNKAAAYIVSLYNMVSMIYEEEMNVIIRIVKTKIWTKDEHDGYVNSGVSDGDNQALLEEFVTRWRKDNTPRNLCNLLSRPGGTRVLGIANSIENGLCSTVDKYKSGYAVCGIQSYTDLPTLTSNEEVATIAHENGHLLGAPHSHNCFWSPALDSCTSSNDLYNSTGKVSDACNYGAPIFNEGSIMSYCHLWGKGVRMTFLPRIYNYLRNRIEGKTCVTEPSVALVKIQYPIGNQVLKAGSDTTIHWIASNSIQAVKIEFSADSGATWQVIEGGQQINAKLGGRTYGQGSLKWTVPMVSTTTGLIRVSDASNPATAAVTLAPFTIQIQAIAIDFPKGGEKFGQKEKVDVKWSSTLVNETKVEFSSDGGLTWVTLSTSTTGSFNFDLPDIETNQGIIRISDVTNNKVISQSNIFSIGKEKITLIAPNGGNTICVKDTFNILWSTDFTGASSSRVKIDYSTDKGATWSAITNSIGVSASLGKYPWTAVKNASKEALVRIVYRNDVNVNAISEQVFTLDPCTTSTGIDEPAQDATFATLTVSPNPVSTQGAVTVEFPAPCQKIECTLVDSHGALVAVLGMYDNLSEGKHEFKFDVSTFASGAYFITMNCGGQRVSAPLSIVR